MNEEKTGDKERKPDLDVKGSRCFLHERFKELNSSTHTLLSCHVRRRPEEKSDKKKFKPIFFLSSRMFYTLLPTCKWIFSVPACSCVHVLEDVTPSSQYLQSKVCNTGTTLSSVCLSYFKCVLCGCSLPLFFLDASRPSENLLQAGMCGVVPSHSAKPTLNPAWTGPDRARVHTPQQLWRTFLNVSIISW